MNNFSCSSYSEYKENNDDDQYKNEKNLQNGDHPVKLIKQMVSRKDAKFFTRDAMTYFLCASLRLCVKYLFQYDSTERR